MDTLEKAELTYSICHIAYLHLGIPIYSSEVPDTAGRKTKKRRKAIAKRFTLHAIPTNFKTLLVQEIIHLAVLFKLWLQF